ncbi:MAG: sigma-54-dependent Fis family transcriptional regulator [Sedimentisphaerales bacterium]|nr:sigma-54-dependent Fis family transcriptional regulator [Sedimentisphaerales bacterium]
MQQQKNLKTNQKQINKENIANVLIADNDSQTTRFLLEILARKGIRGHIISKKESVIDFINKGSCDLVFAGDAIGGQPESSNKGGDGFELVEKIRENSPELPVIMIEQARLECLQNQRQIIERAVRAVRRGCCDFLIKPLEREKVEMLLDTFLPNHGYSTIDSAHDGVRCLYQIVGRSVKLNQTVELAKKISPTSAPVLISGESGTGKELIAYLIHHKSRRTGGTYVRINCAALSDSLLESELFGHEKGAFTGAYARRKGRFEMAHGGTLLLDEITETPIRFQAKLLRVLEQQDFERVGGNESVRVDVRIISTTNRDLQREVEQGRFRRDLYYRLNAVRLTLSPLRERSDDLQDLIWYFVNLYSREVQRHITDIDPAMMEIFSKYHWPGNVRQLRNVVRTSLMLGVGPVLSLADVSWLFDELQPLRQQECKYKEPSCSFSLPSFEGYSQENPSMEQDDEFGLGGLPLEQVERRAILETLRRTGGNQTKAAKVLGISDRTLRDRIHRYRKEGSLQPA